MNPDASGAWSEAEIVEAELGAELIRLLEESYGKGAAAVQVLLGEDAVVVFFDELHLQLSEQFLIDQGHGETVIHTRNMYQQAVETSFRAAVERIIGRRVISFASTTKLDPNYAVEIFRLAPLGEQVDLGDLAAP